MVLATPDVSASVRDLEDRLGVRLNEGGRHPAWGTRNALLPLGPTRYLEVIGPDLDRGTTALPTLFGIDRLRSPRLATWAAKGTDLRALTERARSRGIELGAVSTGSRLRPDGTALDWQLTDPFSPREGGILPFFIDWPGRGHPAAEALAEVELVKLEARHPTPDRVMIALRQLEIDLRVSEGPEPALIADLRGPGGRIRLT